MTPHSNLGHFWIIIEGWSQILLSIKLFLYRFNKSAPPWRRKSWRKRYSHTMRMQNQAKLAAGAHRGYMAKYTSKCLHWSAATMPAAALCAAAILGGGVAPSNPPPNICGGYLNLLTEISPSKISPPPIHTFGLCHQVRKLSFQTHHCFPMMLILNKWMKIAFIIARKEIM